MSVAERTPHVCFVGLNNLRVLAPDHCGGFVGGAELQQTLLARALVARGFKVSMVVADHGQADGACWDGIVTYKAYRMDAGVPILRFFHPRLSRTWAALRRADADIYYSSCSDVVVAIVAAFARRHRRRAVFRIASDVDCDPKRTFFLLRRKKWSFLRLLCDNSLYRFGLRGTHLILAQTTAQQQAMRENFGKPSRVVPSLVDVEPLRHPFEQRDIAVLWVGTVRALKRPELLFELAARLPQVHFTLVGGAATEDPAYFERVRAAAARLANVTMPGFVPVEQIKTYFERARVLINTSAVEGFPNTYLQAWAHGTPVVAFHDPDGVIERHGLGRTAASLEEMYVAVAKLAGEASTWGEASGRCSDYFNRTFSTGRTASAFAQALWECA
jgi:glycosyltransferase involved in cell wall biosynthesis